MKYLIIALIITSVLVITSYILDLTNNKTDKVFLYLISALLVICGLYFSIKGEIIKEEVAKIESDKLSKTKRNTEELKKKSAIIIADINENLENLIVINDSVSQLSKSLGGVEKDISKQLEVFNKTLDKTKILEGKVKEQLEIETRRFESERPKIKILKAIFIENSPPENVKEEIFSLRYYFFNSSRRTALNVKPKTILIFSNDYFFDSINRVIKFTDDEFPIPLVNKSSSDPYYIHKPFFLKKDEFYNNLKGIALIVKWSFVDEVTNNTYESNSFYQWRGYEFDKFNFVLLKEKPKIINYLKANNLKEYLTEESLKD